jgi:hypothetical protein
MSFYFFSRSEKDFHTLFLDYGANIYYIFYNCKYLYKLF